MSNLETGENKMKENTFFTFSKPYLDFIGKGKIFGFVYYIMAIINLLIPFAIISAVIESKALSYGAKFVFAIILSWVVIAFGSWIGFQLWWNRRTKIINTTSSEFIATICFSDIFQTFGEWVGTMFGIIGAGVGFITLIFFRNDAEYLYELIGLSFLKSGPIVIFFGGPILGFFIIIFSRFLAEQLRLFASLVNNTKDIATNLQGLFLVSKKMLLNNAKNVVTKKI